MECLSGSKLPEGPQWIWELKWDGYRAVAVKDSTSVRLYSRNNKLLNKRFPYIADALKELPSDTVVDGEIVALDDIGRPNSNVLQNFVDYLSGPAEENSCNLGSEYLTKRLTLAAIC
jgi:ATP-dependent DNA ligase